MRRLAFLCLLGLSTACSEPPPYAGDWRDLLRGEKDSKFGFVDRSGRFVIAPTFKFVAPFTEGLAGAYGSGGYGYIDKTGAWVIRPQFGHAWAFSEGLAAIEDRRRRWGFIDPTGQLGIEPRFDEAHQFVGGLAAVKVGSEWAFIDRSGRFAFDRRFPDTPNFLYWKSDFSEGVAVIKLKHGHFTLLAPDGGEIASLEADEVHRFRDGLALVRLPHDDRCHSQIYRYIDKTGAFAFPERFCDARDFSDGMAQVFAAGKWGYIDKTGAFALEPQFEVTGEFSEGLAPVKRDGRDVHWDYIDKRGKVVIAAVGDGRADPFERGVATIDLHSPNGFWAAGARWGYIDRTGRVIGVFTRGSSRTY